MLYKGIMLSIVLLGPIISNAMEIIELPSQELLQKRLCEHGFNQLAGDAAFTEKFAGKKMLPHDVATSIPRLVKDYYKKTLYALTSSKNEQNASDASILYQPQEEALIAILRTKEIIECMLSDHPEILNNFLISPILSAYAMAPVQLPSAKLLEQRLRAAGFNDLIKHSTIIQDLGDKEIVPAIMAAQLLRKFVMPCIAATGNDTQEFTHGGNSNKRIELIKLILQDHPEEFKKLEHHHELILELEADLR